MAWTRARQAIEADSKGEYESALGLYKKSLDYFMAVRRRVACAVPV